jgi:Xaa-Pro dipeptidase
MAPTDPQSSHLEEGMVVTVEPGIYFSVYALQHFYLPSPIHSQYINTEVLERYLPVGGVRIEDDLLITSTGYENLTTAPKGDAMLDIIRSGHSGSSTSPKRPTTASRKTNEQEIPLMRAPGIFKRSMTTDENAQRWRQQSMTKDQTTEMGHKPSKTTMKTPATGPPPSVCGEASSNLQHVYLSSALGTLLEVRAKSEAQGLPHCKNCQILVQTLDRLRQNLGSSPQTSPTQATPPLEKREETPTLLQNKSQDHIISTATLARAQTFPGNFPAHHSSTRMSPNRDAPQSHARSSPEALIRRKSGIPGQNPLVTTIKPVAFPQDLKPFASTGPHYQTPTSNTHPVPTTEDPYEVARQQELDSLKLRLKSLEEQARLKARRHENSIRFNQRPSTRPSLPILRSDRVQQQPKEYANSSRRQTMPSP